MNQAGWARLVLRYAGLPTTPGNLDAICRWMADEEPASDWWRTNDPLNYGHPTTSPSGMLPSLREAARLVANALQTSPYWGIYSALARSASLAAEISPAIVTSPWSADHYGGTLAHVADTPAPPMVQAPVTREETGMLAMCFAGDQLHITATTPTGKVVRHWWQPTSGPDAGKLFGPQILPEPS